MFSILPDLTPRDSHSLWYVSSRSPLPPPPVESTGLDGVNGSAPHHQQHQHRRHNQGGAPHALDRSALARLRADEVYQERRRQNVGNFGSTWLKPPGVAKTLFQIREERREAEEHAEVMRREQLAQQLADAEGNAAGLADLDMMDEADGEAGGEGERDLDDEIPDADADGFGFNAALSDDEEEDEEELDEDGDGEQHSDGDEPPDEAARPRPGGGDANAAQRRELRQMVATEDRVLGLMTRGQAQQSRDDDLYGAEDDEAEDQATMLQEDDLLHGAQDPIGLEPGSEMDMDADLDDDIPEAESGMYEHTDSEVSLSSSDDDNGDEDGEPNASFAIGHPSVSQRFVANAPRFDTPRSSLDISSILSRDGSSSIPGSSPQVRRRP